MKRIIAALICSFIIISAAGCHNGFDNPQVSSELSSAVIDSTGVSSDFEVSKADEASSDAISKAVSSNKSDNLKTSSSSKNTVSKAPANNSRANEQDRNDTISLKNLYPANTYYNVISDSQRWYYSKLNSKHRGIYNTVKNAILNRHQGMIQLGRCTYPELVLVYNAVKSDYPELFWIPDEYAYELTNDKMSIAFNYNFTNKKIDYLYSDNEILKTSAQIRSAVADALRYINADMTPYEKEIALHSWLNFRVTYDDAAAANSDANPNAFNIYGALVEGKAVCEGYSRALQFLLNYVGIESTLVTGKISGVGHMWNLVKLDGSWYHLDSTWNDSNDAGYHTYFNVTDRTILLDHKIDPDYYTLNYDELSTGQGFNLSIPKCNDTKYNFYVKNGTYIYDEDSMANTIAEGLKAAAKLGKTSCEFSFSDEYGRKFVSPLLFLNEIKKLGCVTLANQALPAGLKISNLSCRGIVGSSAFTLSW